MVGLIIKHTTELDELELIQEIIAKYGFGNLEEHGDDMVAPAYSPVSANAIADMDRELIKRIGGHLEVLLS